ncbi:hypothetical protein HYT57_03405 [Candidatus Woesearchaeota archaeon]|nr:hypothetical protein [Candidatus Woesearchaeota archaeon]
MTLVNYCGKVGDTKRYLIQLGPDRVEALISDNGSCLKVSGEVADRELTELIAQEMRDLVLRQQNGELVTRVNEILEGIGEETVEPEEYTQNIDPQALKDLKEAFREWKGRATPYQRRVLAKIGLMYIDGEDGKGHHRIARIDDPKKFVSMPSSPSDVRTGRNKATQIVTRLLRD